MRKTSPFTPGYGGMPPYLAGRESEQVIFADAMARCKAGRPNRGIVMYGPRGMGKTALLGWLEAQCREAGIVPILTTPAVGLRSYDDLPKLLLPRDWLPGKVAFNMGNILTTQWDIKDSGGNKVYGSLTEHLAAACKKTPCALLLDEAHTLDKDVCQSLLGLMQSVINNAPFLFVMAGTPGLMPFLGTVGATFVGRSKKIGVGTLSDQTAADAIRIPLEKEGVAIADDALAAIVKDSQRYPFFLQLWGWALWDCAAGHGVSRLTEEHARAVGAAVGTERMEYYDGRFEEIRKKRELHAAAVAVADAYHVAGQYDKDGISEIINIALKRRVADEDARWEKAESMIDELVALGYIWRPARQPFMQAGIPSLMDYIAQRRPRQQPPLSPADAKRISAESRERQSEPLS